MKNQWYRAGKRLLDEIRNCQYSDELAAVWYIGQMGLVVKWKDIVIYIDPVLNDLIKADGTTRRNYPAPFTGDMVDRVDYIICSHGHADHMNASTLKPMLQSNPNVKIVVPAPEVTGLIEKGIDPEVLIGAKAGDKLLFKEDVKVIPIAAAHEEYQKDVNGDYYHLGYVLQLSELSLYHSGDTLLTEQLVSDLNNYSPLAAAFVAINGIDLERRRRGIIGNMDCRDAAYFVNQIGADLAVPFHFDMVEGNGENPLIFAHYMEELYPGSKYKIMKLGERILLESVKTIAE